MEREMWRGGEKGKRDLFRKRKREREDGEARYLFAGFVN